MIETAEIGHAGVERVLTRVPEGWMAEIVRQGQRFGEILVETKDAGDGARDLRHFEAVGEARPVVIALVIDENLGLVLQTPEGR